MMRPRAPTTTRRAWAFGFLPLEAATEMLIRGGYAQPSRPWVKSTDAGYASQPYIDFASIPDLLGGLSVGQRRFLLIATSLGAHDTAIPVSLRDELTGLDREHLHLVLAAIAHTGGVSTPERVAVLVEGHMGYEEIAPLYTWP